MYLPYKLSQEFRDQTYIETGVRPDHQTGLNVPDQELNREFRAWFTANAAVLSSPIRLPSWALDEGDMPHATVDGVQGTKTRWPERPKMKRTDTMASVPVFDHLPTVTELTDAYMATQTAPPTALSASLAELVARFDTALAAAKIESTRMADERKAREAAEEASKAEAKTAERARRIEWSQTHGSDRLRRGLEAGHDCTRLYLVEFYRRAAPNFMLDVEGSAEWKERNCPSAEALDALDAAKTLGIGDASIVWLTSAPSDTKRSGEAEEFYESEFEPCEAITINTDGCKYWLVQAL